MRTLEKNKRVCYYAIPTGKNEMLKDEFGNYTSEIKQGYTSAHELRVNYSSSTGEETTQAFGTFTDYNKTMVFSNDCPLVEGAKVWIDTVPDDDEANFEVVRISTSPNVTLVALKERP